MNRNNNLILSLFSWLQCKEVSEIIILDWSSSIPVKTSITHLISGTSKSVIIARIEDQSKWILSIAYNIAASLTNYNTILKLDCDDILHIDFFKNHKLHKHKGSFYCGNWKNALTPNEKHLNGVLFTRSQDFNEVNGYNEFIQTYGWDDSDIYERLQSVGLNPLSINNSFIQHIEHSDRGDDTFRSIQTNRLLCTFDGAKWNKNIPKTKWIVIDKEVNNLVIKITQLTIVPLELLKMASDKFEVLYTEKASTKNVIYAYVRNGLGNRLRVFASTYNLYKALQAFHSGIARWKFILVWIPDEHCDIEFDKLFHVPVDISLIATLPHLPSSYINIQSDMTVNSSIQTITPLNLFTYIDEAKSPSIVWIESASIIETKYYKWVDDAIFLRQLRITDEVKILVDSTVQHLIKQDIDIEDMVGVCIRQGAGGKCDDVSGWNNDKKKQWAKWRSASTVENFIQKMKTFPSSTRFFVTGDGKDIVPRLEEEFGTRIFHLARKEWNRCSKQVYYALADVLLLAKTRETLGSNWSSYSEAVRRFSDKRMQIAGLDFSKVN